MGFLPPQNVKPITLFVPSQDENIPDSFSTEDIGKKFRGVGQSVTVEDIIRIGGERIPSSENSAKNFKVAFVLVLDTNQKLTNAQIKKMLSFSRNFPVEWNRATRGLSSMNRNK